MLKRFHPVKWLAVLACTATFCLGTVWGQAMNSADVTGSVTDPSGAVVPGVTVIARNIDKNTERTIATNEAGAYDTGPLAPGDQYMLIFKKEGFATLQRGPMTLRTGVIGINVQLTLGAATQEIMVSEAAPLLETTSSEKSSTLAAETLAQLPQVGQPDWQAFIILMPGMSGTGGTNTVTMDGVSANGSMPFSTALFDGANTNSPMSNNVINTPIFDIISEVKMTTSLFSAQYGSGGALFNQITKGGTNQFHGMGYDYLRNTVLNANAFQFGTTAARTPVHYNALGGNVGGPIIKNKIFFFYGMERIISHGAANVTYISVPTSAMLDGNFAGMAAIYDPATQAVDATSGVVTRQPFASNRIPSPMLDPVAKNIQAFFPKPNLPGTVANGVTTNNYQYAIPSKAPRIKYFGRFDADIIKNHRVTGSATWNDNWTEGTGPIAPVNVNDSDIMNSNAQLSDYWTISPTTLNEFRWGFMAEYDKLKPQTMNQGYPGKLGLKFSKADIFPGISITNIYGLAGGNPSHANYQENQHDISDAVTLIRGRHTLHLGANIIYMIADSTAWGNINGATLGFTGVYTAGSNVGSLASTTGVPYADFLLGYARSWSASVSPQYAGRLRNPAAFVQDDFKVSPKLTLNLGLRWVGTTGLWDRDGNVRTFDPTVTNPATGKPGAMWYGVTAANGRKALQKSQYNNWLPRIGFAYLLDSKTTVRGGIGFYSFPWNVDTYGGGLGGAFTSSGNLTDSTNNAYPVVLLSSDGNTNYQGSKGTAINAKYGRQPTTPEALNGQAVSFQQYESPVPRLYSWNFTIQRQMTEALVAEIGYVGSYQNNLPFLTDLNQVPEDKLGPTSAQYRPYPFQSVTGSATQGKSNYNSLQTSITQRMRSGLMFSFNYTWSHMLSNQDSSGRGTMMGTQAYQRAYNPDINYGSSNFDVRHAFKGHVVYALPFGKGKTYLSQNAVADKVIGGWTFSGTLVAQTGSPFTPVMATNNSYSQSSNNSWYPNMVGDWRLDNPSINSWFNVNAFATPTAGTFGNMGRNIVLGPGLFSLNSSLAKSFRIWEKVRFDLSANANNILNHPVFGVPDRLIGAGHVAKITSTRVGSRNIEMVLKLVF
jgi:hypothetical protein